VARQRRGVAEHEAPAQALEERGVAERKGMRVIDRIGIGPVQRAGKAGAQMRLCHAEGTGVERNRIHSEIAFRRLGLGEIRGERCGVFVGPDVADRSQQLGSACFLGELLMLRRAGCDQRAVMQRNCGVAR
jgi:hypothetical protein